MARGRVLVIDDERDFAAFVVTVATNLGYEAVAATDSTDFQARYVADPPDVIVLDIVMPPPDGIELVRFLAERGCRSRVIVISGFNPLYAEAAKTIGEYTGGMAITVLRKPVKLDALRAALTAGP